MYGIGSPPKKYKDTSSTLMDNCLLPLQKLWVVDNLLLDHVAVLAVQLVNFVGRIVKGNGV